MKSIVVLLIGLGFMVHGRASVMAQGTEDGEGPEFVMPDDDGADQGPNLVATGRYYGDSIVIRWGALSYPVWQTASRAGFIVERIDEVRAQNGSGWERLTPEPIRPLTIEEWKAHYRPEDSLAGAAVQTLYGGTFATEKDPFGAIYETWTQQQSLHGFAMLLADVAPRLADGMGLRFVDRDITPGTGYVYRIRSLADDPTTPIDTAATVVMTDAPTEVPSIRSLTAVEGETLVILKWYRYETPIPFSGYFIEQSFDGGKTFSRMKEIPFIPANNSTMADNEEGEFDTISYRVELEQNYLPVTYRVVGVDAFGDVSPRSSVVTAMGRDMTPPAAPLISPIEVVQGNGFRVHWRKGVESDGADDLAGFYVGRSGDPDGPFEAISDFLQKDVREFTHYGVDTLLPGYYVVGAVDTAGNLQNSVAAFGILPDSIPPATPTGLAGEIDSNGVVVLHWDGNTERDLQGYRVFFANQEDHEFQQLTTGIYTDTVWSDTLTLNTLSEEIYFRVTAYDQNFNHAPFTEILTLKKPDIVAPVAPVVTRIRPGEDGIALEWYRSPSGDALEHRILRRRAGEGEWKVVFSSSSPEATYWTDSLVERGILYEYGLQATDDDGNDSPMSATVTGRPYDNGVREGVRAVSAWYDEETGTIRIDWRSGGEGVEGRVQLYRSINDGRPGLVASLDGEDPGYEDRDIIPGATYKYRVRVETPDGGESRFVESAVVEL